MKFAYCKHLIKCDLLAINNWGILKNLFFLMNHSLLLFGFALGLGWRVATIAFYIVYLLFFIKGKCVKQEDRFLWEPRLEEA